MIIDGQAPDWVRGLEQSAVFVCIADPTHDQPGTLEANQLGYAMALHLPIYVLLLPGRCLPRLLTGYDDLTTRASQGAERDAAALRRWCTQRGATL